MMAAVEEVVKALERADQVAPAVAVWYRPLAVQETNCNTPAKRESVLEYNKMRGRRGRDTGTSERWWKSIRTARWRPLRESVQQH